MNSELVVAVDFVHSRAFVAPPQIEGIEQRSELSPLAWGGILKTPGEMVLGIGGLIGLEDMIAVLTHDRTLATLEVALGKSLRS